MTNKPKNDSNVPPGVIDGIIERFIKAGGNLAGMKPAIAVPIFAPTIEPPKSKWTLPEEIENFLTAIEVDDFARKVNAVMMGVRDYKQCLEWKKSKTLEIRVNPNVPHGHIWYRFYNKVAKEEQSMLYCTWLDRKKFANNEQCPDPERCGDPQCLIADIHQQ